MGGDGDGAPAPMGGWQDPKTRKAERRRASRRTACQKTRAAAAAESALVADRWVPKVSINVCHCIGATAGSAQQQRSLAAAASVQHFAHACMRAM